MMKKPFLEIRKEKDRYELWIVEREAGMGPGWRKKDYEIMLSSSCDRAKVVGKATTIQDILGYKIKEVEGG